MKKEDIEKGLRRVRTQLADARIIVEGLSTEVEGFPKSKVLNILGKEINSLKVVIDILLGDQKCYTEKEMKYVEPRPPSSLILLKAFKDKREN